MKVRAIYKHTKEEHNLELSVGITGDKHYICIYNNTKNGKIRAGEYSNLEEFYVEWDIISKPEVYSNVTGKDYPPLYEKYMELYQHVLSRFRERALLKIGL